MNASLLRLGVCALALALCLPLSGSAASKGSSAHADKLMVLSTSDMKGKTSPCGCHIPKGGLSRQASFADSMRAQYAQVLVVDAGGFFPEDDLHRPAAGFMMETMKSNGVDAAGVGPRDLTFGVSYLREQAKRSGLALVCANLRDKSGKTIFPPSMVRKVGGVTVGIYGLISDTADPGPSRDSLSIEAPAVAAKRTIADLRKHGATVIVLLSQLGKEEGQNIATDVEGNDAVIVGGPNIPLLQTGRITGRTICVYGGEQGQYMARTLFDVDAHGRASNPTCEVVMLSPEVGEKPDVATRVKVFEDRLNDAMREETKVIQTEAARADSALNGPDAYLGMQICARCHVAETEQWKTTKHARAWQTLVDKHKESTVDCIPCHVLGYQKAGGFRSAGTTPKLVNVQCETCHGMGTLHVAYGKTSAHVAEATCRGCHDATTSSDFEFAKFKRYIDHTHATSDLPPLESNSAMQGMH